MKSINEAAVIGLETSMDKLKHVMDSLSPRDKEWLDLAEQFIAIGRKRLELLEPKKKDNRNDLRLL